MRHFLQYWKHYDSESELGTPIRFSASSQYLRRQIGPTDTIWLVAILARRLTLLGKLQVAEIIDRDEAQRRFEGAYDATTYVIPASDTQLSIREIDIQDLVPDLRFLSEVDRLPDNASESVDGKSLQSLRELSSESVDLLNAALSEPYDKGSESVTENLLEAITKTLVSFGGIATLQQIYTGARERVGLVYESSIRRTIQQHSSDTITWKGKRDIFYSAAGIGKGLWGLRSMLAIAPEASDLQSEVLGQGNAQPTRALVQVYRIIRDTKLSREIKAMYGHQCQICKMSIMLPDGSFYSEAHHIRPLGGVHKGTDTAGNILVVCPNHHAMLDYVVIPLVLKDLFIHENHAISIESIDYHHRLYQAAKSINSLATRG